MFTLATLQNVQRMSGMGLTILILEYKNNLGGCFGKQVRPGGYMPRALLNFLFTWKTKPIIVKDIKYVGHGFGDNLCKL